MKQPSFVCDDTPDPTSASGTLRRLRSAAAVPVTRAQVKLIVAYKVRAVWGRYAARHIRRYGCDLYRLPDEIGQTGTSCMTNFVSRRHRTVTRQLILSYGPAGPGVVGVTVRRFPKDETGPGTDPVGPGSHARSGRHHRADLDGWRVRRSPPTASAPPPRAHVSMSSIR